MKIRNGFVSNSSSASFVIPSFLLTEEQKELLLSIDDSKEIKRRIANKIGDAGWEDSKNNYKVNKKYHKILDRMTKKKQFDDSWSTGENKEYQTIRGSTLMDNGGLIELMSAIGIDTSMVEITNEGSTKLAKHPESIKHFSLLINNEIKEFRLKTKEEQEIEIKTGIAPMLINPYELEDKHFKYNGYSGFAYEDPDQGHEFIRETKNED